MTNLTCVTCGTGLTGKQRAHCSRPCAIKADSAKRRETGARRNYAHTRVCPICTATFKGKSAQVYCSKQCQLDSCREQSMAAMQAGFEAWRLEQQSVVRYQRPRVWLGGEVKSGVGFTTGPCQHCRKSFTSVNLTGRYCSDRCGKAAGAGRREQRRGKFYMPPTRRNEIAHLFGWVCHLCQTPIPSNVDYTHPLSLTMDHVIPRSVGATPDDSPRNLLPAHRHCNAARGNRPIEQPSFYLAHLARLGIELAA